MKIKPIASEDGVVKDNLILRCQDCLHFKGTRSPIYDTVCKNRGILANAVAPNCYTPNIAVFRPLGINFYQTLRALTANLPPSTVRVLTGIFKTSPKLKSKGLTIFQKVYFSIGNPKYLSNWFTGYVVAPGMSPRLFLVAGSLKRSTRVVTALLDVESMVTQEKFVDLREAMVAKGNLVDPENLRTKFKPLNAKAAEYEPPTIDKINEDLVIKKRVEEQKIRKKGSTIHVVTPDKKLMPANSGFPKKASAKKASTKKAATKTSAKKASAKKAVAKKTVTQTASKVPKKVVTKRVKKDRVFTI